MYFTDLRFHITCGILLLVLFFPYRVLGVESDSRYYSNHVVSKLTGREESTAIFDTFVTFYPDGKICILKMKDGYGYQFLERDQQ